MTLAQALLNAQSLGLDRLDAQMLLLHALGRSAHDRAWLLTHSDDAMPEAAHTVLQTLAMRRAAGEPLAYITSFKEFYGLTLHVDARVLDPRADTETLVDWALEVMDAQAPAALIDLGTGSGAIALALKKSRAAWQVHALDFSGEALAVAVANAARLQLPVVFRQGTWLDDVLDTFAVIVSNPPYVAVHDPHLADLAHEPTQALTSGIDGLEDIRAIIRQAPARLTNGGWLLLEHGYDQAEAVCSLLLTTGFSEVQSRHDLAGIARCSGGKYLVPENLKVGGSSSVQARLL